MHLRLSYPRNSFLTLLFLMTSINGLLCQLGQTEFPYNSYICYKSIDTIQIDGIDTGSEWAKAPWSGAFVDIEGTAKETPPFETRVKMLWDDEYFYFYAELEEPHVWGILTKRDAVIFYDDDFEIFIDPDGDGHNYYEFELNALNTLWELILLRPYRADDRPKVLNNWNIPNIRTAVNINGSLNDPSDLDQSWSVEWAIPWDALKELSGMAIPPQDEDQWRVNFSRVDWDMSAEDGKYIKKEDLKTGKNLPEHNWVWQPIGKINMHMPEEWGYVQFSLADGAESKSIFVEDKDIFLKKHLWEIYLAQLSRLNTGESIALNINELELTKPNISCATETKIISTSIGYHIEVLSCTTGITWVINSEGRLFSKEK
ncbi:MAG: hypothetical protein ACJA01_001872 [Saprospiraceae bacterium]|jgi:hypothetical protein